MLHSIGIADAGVNRSLWRLSRPELTGGIILQAMYVRPPGENLDAFLPAVLVYSDDIVLLEPTLLERYDALLPQLDQALGETGAAR